MCSRAGAFLITVLILFGFLVAPTAVAVEWEEDGYGVCSVADNQSNPQLVSDGSGGVILAWQDYRGGGYDVFAQRLDNSGAPQWEDDGVAVSAATNDQSDCRFVVDGSGGAILTWEDERSGAGGDVYAQRIEPRYGEWGWPEPAAASASDNPGDQGGQVVVEWDASGRDRFYDPLIGEYSVWLTTSYATSPMGTKAEDAGRETMKASGFQVFSDPGEALKAGGPVVWAEDTPAGPVYWERVAVQEAVFLDTYGATVATRQDSAGGGPAVHYFKVLALGLPSAASVELEVYDVLGRRVAHRDLGTLGTGWQEVRFEGRDDKGRPLSSGVYFYRVSAAGETLTRKMVIRRQGRGTPGGEPTPESCRRRRRCARPSRGPAGVFLRRRTSSAGGPSVQRRPRSAGAPS